MSNPFQAKNFEAALKHLRTAREGDLALTHEALPEPPKSKRYVSRGQAKASHFGRSSTLYGTHRRSPSSLNIIKDPAEGWEMAVGEVERLNDKIKDRREFRWFLEVIIGLSDQQRVRTFVAILFPPFQLQVDPQSFRDSRVHMEHMAARAGRTAHFEGRVRGFFDEDPEEVADFLGIDVGSLPGGGASFIRQENYTNDGLLHLIEELCDGTFAPLTYANGTPGGDVMIRISLDSSYGIVVDRSSLKSEGSRDMVKAWLHDIKSFTSGDNRNFYFDITTKAYARKSREQEKPLSNRVEVMLAELEKGMQ